MLKKIVETLKNLNNRGAAFDPSSFNDPVAMQTEWKPLKGGGSNLKTHKLVEVNYHRLEFQATIFARIFFIIFIIIGIGVVLFFSMNVIDWNDISVSFELIIPIVFGSIFTLVGSIMLYMGTAPIVFDKTNGYFWKGRKEPVQTYDQSMKKLSAPLSDIHALQIISEHVSSSKSSYFSYELNLILRDGNRINVIDHGKLESVRTDAQRLATFLGLPVWDSLL